MSAVAIMEIAEAAGVQVATIEKVVRETRNGYRKLWRGAELELIENDDACGAAIRFDSLPQEIREALVERDQRPLQFSDENGGEDADAEV